MEFIKELTFVLFSGSAAGLIVIFLLKKIITERIKQSINHEYQVSIEKIKKDLNIRSNYEGDILYTQINVYLELAGQVAELTHNSLQLIYQLKTVMDEGEKKGKTEQEILTDINILYEKKSPDILEQSMLLKKYYVLLPISVIDGLLNLQDVIWDLIKDQNFHISPSLINAEEKLLKTIREINSKLLSGEEELSTLLSEAPKNGFIPKYMRSVIFN